MENLVPREIYESDASGYWKRLRVFSGIGFGIFSGVVFEVSTGILEPIHRSIWSHVFIGVLIGVFGGLFFGFFYPRSFRRRMSSVSDAIYLGRPEFDVPPPPGPRWEYRLPCSYLLSDHFAVGGVLYIGPSGLLFMPHKKNLEKHRVPLEMGPIDNLHLSLTSPQLNWYFRLLVPHPVPRLNVEWPNGNAIFLIPEPDSVSQLIEGAQRRMSMM